MKQLIVKSVDALVHEFAQRFEQFCIPSVAKGACKFTSYELAKYLKQNHTACDLLHLQGRIDECPDAQSIWLKKPQDKWSHYVVAVGDTVYDLTATQFDPKIAYPFSCNLAYLRRRWRTVERDDFINSLVDNFYPGT